MTTEFLEGDLVEAVKGEERHIGRLAFNSFVKGLILGAPGGSLDWFTKEGFTLTLIERAPDPLPIEQGMYSSGSTLSSAGVLQLDGSGRWWWVGNSFQPNPERLHGDRARDHMPLTRLESRADTAKAVISEVMVRREKFQGSSYVIHAATLVEILESFGVTDA